MESRAVAYRRAKQLATQVNIPVAVLRAHWPRGTRAYWNSKVEDYRGIIQATERRNRLREAIINMNFNAIMQFVVEGVFLTPEQANIVFNDIIRAGNHNIVIESRASGIIHRPINNITRNLILNIITGNVENRDRDEYYAELELTYADIISLRIERYQAPARRLPNRDGSFFPYINTTKIDLSKYQIYNQDQAYDVKIHKKREQCLIHALSQAGIAKTITNQIKLSFINGASIRKTDLPKIANIIKRDIVLHYIDDSRKQTRTYKYEGQTNLISIDLAIYENHYFIYEPTIYARYAIENYEQYKDVKDFHNIFAKDLSKTCGYKRSTTERKIDSLTMINILFKQGQFKRLDLVRFEESSKLASLKEHIYLDNIENEQRPIIIKGTASPLKPCLGQRGFEGHAPQNEAMVYFADFESITTGKHHELYLAGITNLGSDNVNIFDVVSEGGPQKLIDKLLDFITQGGTQPGNCYFHNLKYDYHLMEQYLNIKSKCVKDNQIYSIDAIYNGKRVRFIDSFKMINMALSKFQSEFNLDKEFAKKEAIAYTYYNNENHNKRININEYANLLTVQEKEIFMKQIKDEKSYDEILKTFNPLEYYKEYIRLDCLVLKKGMEKFNTMIEEITDGELSIYDCLTISSLTDRFMKISGAYKGVYEIGGNLRAYVAKAVYGGRVNVNEKYKKLVINKKIADYDGVSLYPSAINRLCREMGLPKGKAERFNKDQLPQWKCFDYAIMTVKINKVNKKQQMPFIAFKSDDTINYLNEVPPDSEPIVIDSITLEDYINFHKIDYEILDGVYWNNGFNTLMGSVIQKLFHRRLQCKKEGNTALSNVIKLMLNSSYGKTIIKKTNVKHQIVRNTDEKFNSYIYNHFNTIKGYRKLNENCYEVESICADHSYNRGHIGCAILSMSKRIMNEVFDVANTNDLPIYYTDTDSIHCNYDDVATLEKAYKEKYHRELNGKNLEQFHVDFDLKGAASEVYSTRSIFLGKKSYIDCLESTDKDGNLIHGYHFRLKGITKEGLIHESEKYADGIFGLYKELSTGASKKITLNPVNKDKDQNKVLFEFKQGKVSTKTEFIREVSF